MRKVKSAVYEENKRGMKKSSSKDFFKNKNNAIKLKNQKLNTFKI